MGPALAQRLWRPPEEVELGPRGLVVRGTGLHLDARRKSALSFVSHAHGDHIARHQSVIATAETLALLEHRLGRVPEARPLAYRAPIEVEGLGVELFPAGHVLGSAQIRITRPDRRRVVYTGDLNVRPSATAAATEVASCDVLVIEATFGHPRYRFPPRDAIVAGLMAFIERSLGEGRTPILFGYALGKAQEAARLVGDAGYPVAAHATVWSLCRVYERCGVSFPNLRRYDGRAGKGEVLVFPPNLARSATVSRVTPRRTAILSGWALDGNARYRYGTDEAIPLSDHADFDGLVEYALATGARRVFTHHGFDQDLALALRNRGVDAQPLRPKAQLELF